MFVKLSLLRIPSLFTHLYSGRHLSTLLWPYGIAIPIFGLVLLFYSTLFLLKAACVDPGFLPRASAAEGEYFERFADGGSPKLCLLMSS